MLPLVFAAVAGNGFASAFTSVFALALLAGLRLYGGLLAGAGRFCVGVVVVFFGVGLGDGVDVVATPRLRYANRAGAADRVNDRPDEDPIQLLAALDAEAMVCS